MSHYAKVQTRLIDPDRIKEALCDVMTEYGITPDDIEMHGDAQTLIGYNGLSRNEKAHIIIRRKHLGRWMNDIGFVYNHDTGTYDGIIETTILNRDPNWHQKLTQRYAYHTTLHQMTEQGFTVAEEVEEDGTIHLVLQRGG
jgi:hypothetical protein